VSAVPLFPAFLALDGRNVLLLGDGEAADRRAATLIRSGAILRRALVFRPELLDGVALAIGAEAEDRELLAMFEAARERGIPVNVVDRPALGTFITPAVVERLPLQIAICSAGSAPVLARLLRARIETLVDPAYGRLAELAERLKRLTRARLPDVVRRRRMLERALGGRAASLMLAGDERGAEAAYLEELDAAERGSMERERGLVHFIDPGPGDADLVVLRALRLLGEADIIVHRPDESGSVLDVARRDAGRMAVTGNATALLLTLAGEGRRVVRLSPHPGEQAALRSAGITTEFVPGVGGGYNAD
jgi:uroporphyrin-III C-methyltransferase/precorrin-2 dehydrogenase/sirohydrochlorin ferrochelatase